MAEVQAALGARAPASLDDILTPPLVARAPGARTEIEAELNNNAQSILGYVVRWIDFGIGCSKVPDFYNVALMEDRATCASRASTSRTGCVTAICTPAQVHGGAARAWRAWSTHRTAADPAYRPMCRDLDGNIAFRAACDLIFEGRAQPNGYTEAILHARRKQRKAAARA